MTHTIQLNEKGSRHLDVTEENLQTIQAYDLFNGLVSSHGYVTEEQLDKLKYTIRGLIANAEGNSKALVDLCIDVVYHNDMKAFGLQNLLALYRNWEATHQQASE